MRTMAEYIKREDAIKIVERYGLANGSVLGRHTGLADCIASEIAAIPTADVAPVVHAAWIFFCGVGEHFPRCSRCGEEADEEIARPYCAYCGARMDMPHEFDYSDDRKRRDGGRK